jgi:membrane protease YdiL (CAAX protease family)
MDPNGYEALCARRNAGTLTWRGPALMLFARSAFAVAAQALVVAVFAARSSPAPWRDSAAWLPVYGTLIDMGCLLLLAWLVRREGLPLLDLVSLDRARLGRDLRLGLLLIAPSLVFILAGISGAGWIFYGTFAPPNIYAPLPLWAALYGVLVWPFVWGFGEQMTYNGYLAPRFQALYGGAAVALVVFSWSFQHVVMPVTFDARFWAYRLLAPVPFSIFATLLYLRLRRLLPLAFAHGLMDGAGVLIGVLVPLLW